MTQDIQTAFRIVGFGASPFDAVLGALKLPSFSLNPYALIRQFWAQVQGRSWDQAMASANARAISKNWVPGNLDAKNDFIALLISTAINAKILADRGHTEASNNLARTMKVLADRAKIGTPSGDAIGKMKSNTAGNIEIGIPIIIAAVIAEALIVVGVVVALLYFSSQVIDDVLAKIECDRELMRIHAEYNKVVDRHVNDPNLPWTDDDRKLAERLEEQQRFVAAGCTKTKEGLPWGWWAIGGVAVTAGVLGVAYHEEIKGWFARRAR